MSPERSKLGVRTHLSSPKWNTRAACGQKLTAANLVREGDDPTCMVCSAGLKRRETRTVPREVAEKLFASGAAALAHLERVHDNNGNDWGDTEAATVADDLAEVLDGARTAGLGFPKGARHG